MATNPDLRDQAYQFFQEEAPELLQTIESGLLSLRQEHNPADIHQIMRAAHSLKGGAASVGLEPIKAIAHRLETLFKALYSQGLTIDAELEDQLLKAYDCLRVPLTEQLTQGKFEPDRALAQAESVLQRLEQQLAQAIAETENFIPSSADLGFDMATSIFEVDVQQGLERLEAVLDNPETYEIAGELRAQAEIFMGFAELLDLPGFAAIAETTLKALDTVPTQALAITRLALQDFHQGRADVLNKASESGGNPSAALQAFAEGATPSVPREETPPASPLADVFATASATQEPVALEAIHAPETAEPASQEPAQNQSLTDAEALAWLAETDQRGNDLGALANLLEAAVADKEGGIVPEAKSIGASELVTTGNGADSIDAIFADLNESDENWLAPETDRCEAAAIETVSDATSEDQHNPSPVQGSTLPVTTTLTNADVPLPAGMTVRVDTQRLARLENQLGEITINRNGLDLQNNQIRLGLKELTNRFERVRTTVEQLQTISDQILIAPERQHQPVTMGTVASMKPAIRNRPDGFDSLEMDTYTALYTYTQSLLEDMVQLEEAAADLDLFNRQSEHLLGQHRKMLSQVQDDLMYARMVPLGQVLRRFPRVLRDLSNRYGKPAELNLQGTDLLVERAVVEKLYDPLLHLLRNGFDHGLETPEERLQHGKSETGHLAIRAFYRGRQIVIDIQDDGRGLDLDRVRQRAVGLGWLTEDEAAGASSDQISRYIFEPGFSTAETVSDLSGRGVGLDVVREQLRLLRGTVSVQSVVGEGTRFTLALPMALSIVNLLICFIGSTPIAFRSDSIAEILVPQPRHLSHINGHPHLLWQEQPIPLYRLNELLPYRCVLPEMPLSRVLAAVPSPSDWEAPAIILKQGHQAFALQVDRLVTEQESVIKPFGSALTPPAYAYGCTVLGDGSLVPVIDGQAFLEDLLNRSTAQNGLGDIKTAVAAVADQTRQTSQDRAVLTRATTLMVVDDAVTSRRTLALSLERAGYRVLQARDGQEALEQLQQNPQVRLVVCDIEMPNMNGFEFLTQRRQTPKIAQIPTIMLTSRSNDKHRWLAMQLGATDYFTKPYLEQEFLQAIATQLEVPAPSHG